MGSPEAAFGRVGALIYIYIHIFVCVARHGLMYIKSKNTGVCSNPPACPHASTRAGTQARAHSLTQLYSHSRTHSLDSDPCWFNFLPIDYRPFLPSSLIGHDIILGGYWHVVLL